jgi:arabinofuranan 3-O-arabinosyltransferase
VSVPVPAAAASSVRLEVTEVQGEGLPVLSEVDVSGARVVSDPEAAAAECVTLATVDGEPLRVRVVGGVEGEGARLVAGCDPLTLSTGEHSLRSVPGWTTDTLVLRDRIGEVAIPGQAGPAITVDRASPSEYRIRAAAASEPYLLVVGQNVHPGWRATQDGVDLGPPVTVDGYALGWWVRDLGPHEFTVEFAPQGPSDAALLVSGGALVASAALVLLPPRWVGRPAGPVPAAPAPSGARAPAAPTSTVERRWRARLGWVVLVLGCWVFGGPPALVTGLVLAAWYAVRPPRPSTLLRLAVVAMTFVPLAWVVGNLERWGEVSPQLVLGNPAPSVAAVVALVLLVVGAWRDAGSDDEAA